MRPKHDQRQANGRHQGGVVVTLRRFIHDTQGATMIIFVVALPMVIGALGLGIELGMWFLAKRQVQEAADSGAMQAAFTMRGHADIVDGDESQLTDPVDRAVARSGYSGETPKIDIAPGCCDSSLVVGNEDAVEVKLRANHPTYFINLFGIRSVPIDARAVALVGGGNTKACFLALGNYCTGASNEVEPINISGSASLSLTDCTMHGNGICQRSLKFEGNSLTATECISGTNDIVLSGSSTVDLDCNNPVTGVELDDPFAGVTPITHPTGTLGGSLKAAVAAGGGTVSPSANIYTATGGDKNISGDVHFNPGVYFISGDITFQGNITGTDVVLVLVGDSTIDMNAAASVTLSAPDSDTITDDALYTDIQRPSDQWKENSNGDLIQPFGGLLIYSQRSNSSDKGASCPNKFNGGAGYTYDGFMYMPGTCTAFLGNQGTTSTNDCLMLVSNQIYIAGNNTMQASTSGCSSGQRTFSGAKAVVLVE